jgi:opacity protein-like surface antigen
MRVYAAAAVLWTLVLGAAPAAAVEWPTVREWGLQAGGGNDIRSGVQYYSLQPYVGFGLWHGIDGWLENRGMHALWMIEPWVAFVSDQQGDSQSDSFEIGFSPVFFRLAFGNGALRPYVEGGLGLVYTDLRSEIRVGQDLGQRMQFSEQGGVGLQYLVDDDLAVSLAVRFRHISNAGIADSNPGLDTLYGLIGLSWR